MPLDQPLNKQLEDLAVAWLQAILGNNMLRHTKESKTLDYQRILTLLARRDELRYLKFGLYDRFQ
jgi:hypothetical protein